jgi:flavin reductase (DIM6/NTAB) family NADH-FMN oxidoreductase RutF
MSIDSRRFRDALGRFATGIVIVTATLADKRLGMTVSSFNAVSLDPPLVLFSVNRHADSFAAWQQVHRYAVHVLSDQQEELSNRFARAKGEKWHGLTPVGGKSGVPLLPNALVAFECESYGRYDGGDHEIFVGRVIELHDKPALRGSPLVFYDGRYCRLASTTHMPPSEAVYLYGW